MNLKPLHKTKELEFYTAEVGTVYIIDRSFRTIVIV